MRDAKEARKHVRHKGEEGHVVEGHLAEGHSGEQATVVVSVRGANNVARHDAMRTAGPIACRQAYGHGSRLDQTVPAIGFWPRHRPCAPIAAVRSSRCREAVSDREEESARGSDAASRW